MQTFLPYESFRASAEVIDTKRLGKQRVEAKQILIALGCDVGEHKGNPVSRWRNHPAVKMWRGHEPFLVDYAMSVCVEWISRGCKDTLHPQFHGLSLRLASGVFERPSWLGDDAVHASHRSNLLRKDLRHYSRFGWTEPDDLEYVWPVR